VPNLYSAASLNTSILKIWVKDTIDFLFWDLTRSIAMAGALDGQGDKVKTIDPAPEPVFSMADAKLGDMKSTQATVVAANDLQITGMNDAVAPSTRQERLQEFVDGFGHLGKMYSDSVHDSARFSKFQDRMMNVYTYDHATFKELGRLGDDMTENPPPTPEQIGQALGHSLKNTMDRQLKTGDVNFGGPDMTNLEGAMAGVMLAARAHFDPKTMEAQTQQMVDAMESELRKQNVPDVHAIIWGDTKEPGLAVVPPGGNLGDRHNFNM